MIAKIVLALSLILPIVLIIAVIYYISKMLIKRRDIEKEFKGITIYSSFILSYSVMVWIIYPHFTGPKDIPWVIISGGVVFIVPWMLFYSIRFLINKLMRLK